jgi:hypothetical protein
VSAVQVSHPCWVASWEGDDRSDDEASKGGHYRSAEKVPRGENGEAGFHIGCGGPCVFGLGAFCLTCEDENPDWERRKVVPRSLPACWVVECDGACEDVLEDEETGTVHAPTRTIAENFASTGYGWRFLPGGRAFCEEDAPPGAYLAGVNVAGQMNLDEVP